MDTYDAAAGQKHVQTQDIQFGSLQAARSVHGHAANQMDCALALHVLPSMAALAIAAPYTPRHAAWPSKMFQI